MFANLQGFVISNAGIRECKTSYDLAESVVTVRPAKCKPSGTPDRRRRALALLHDLSKLDGKELECGVQDGVEVFVQGSNSGRKFTFVAANPDSCNDPGSRLVSHLLKIIAP